MKHVSLVALCCVLLSAGCDSSAAEADRTDVAAAPPAPVKRAAPTDLCTLVTEVEAEQVLGRPLAAPQTQPNGNCWYLREGGDDFGDVELILSLISAYPQNEAEFHSFIADQVKEMNESMKKSGVGAVQFNAEPAPNVGAPAYFIDPGLYVLKGNRILAVGVGGAQGVEIAKIALARM